MANLKTIFKTEHGSHLYGLNVETSDKDYYRIYDFPWKKYRPKKQVAQILDENLDITETSLDRFEGMCFHGTPQALETLFSPEDNWIEYDESWYDIRNYIHLGTKYFREEIKETYKRTVSNFFLRDDFKKNRHALRLMHNISDFMRDGIFNPRLSIDVREKITQIAVLPRQQREDIYKDMFFTTFN